MDYFIELFYSEQLYLFVKQYILIRKPDMSKISYIDFKPTGSIFLLILYKGRVKVKFEHQVIHLEPGIYLVGQIYREDIQIYFNTSNEFILVELNPVTLYNILEKPLILYKDKITSIDLIGANALVKQISDTGDSKLKIKLADSFLKSQLTIQKIITDRVFLLTQWISHQNEMIKVDAIADYLNCSERQVERIFQRKIGVSPKFYLKSIQMRQIVNMVLEKGDKPLIDILFERGHYDAPHFNKDFKRLMKMTPLKFFRKETVYTDLIMKINI